jgi:CRP-like cAMP-binding protein
LPDQRFSFFEGVTEDQLESVIGSLHRRRFSCGVTVLVEGDSLHDLYVVQNGIADVFVSDRNGMEHHVNRVGPGGTLGEMSLLTGEPASATVRAASELEVLVLSEAEFHRAAAALPRIYQNVAAVLSRKLYHADRRVLDSTGEVLAWLEDEGAPPLLGYALACSVAWHSRKPTLLLVLCDAAPADELAALAGASRDRATGAASRAHLRLIQCSPSAGDVAPIVDELLKDYAHVLVQARVGTPAFGGRRRIRLAPHSARSNAEALEPEHPTLYAWGSGSGAQRPDLEGCLIIPSLTSAERQYLVDGYPVVPPPGRRWPGWHAT